MKKIMPFFCIMLLIAQVLLGCTKNNSGESSTPVFEKKESISNESQVTVPDIVPSQTPLTPVVLAPTNIPDASDCIPPMFNLAYPIQITQIENIEEQKETLPPSPWVYVANLPDTGSIETIMPLPENEIWLSLFGSNKIFRYSILKDEWSFISGDNDSDIIPFSLLYSGKDLWGLGNSNSNNTRGVWLSIYDEKTDSFKEVASQNKFYGNENYHPVSFPYPEIALDETGFFWVILTDEREDVLFSFNPKTLNVEKRYTTKRNAGLSEPIVAPDGVIWFIERFENKLISYDPISRESHIFIETTPYDAPLSGNSLSKLNIAGSFLYFDRLNHLWIGDLGWLDFSVENPLWYRLNKSPIFIDEAPSTGQYYWGGPSSMYQSSDGTYWFRANNGTVSLNPLNGNWCLFTNSSSPVVEDSQHNLWMVAFGKLYRLPLTP